MQGERFSQVRCGSQVELIIPLSERWSFTPVQATGDHVEAGIDPLVAVQSSAQVPTAPWVTPTDRVLAGRSG